MAKSVSTTSRVNQHSCHKNKDPNKSSSYTMIKATTFANASCTQGPLSQANTENKNQTRRMIRTKLVELLESKFPDANEDVRQAAKVLETMLYRSAPTFTAYQDMSTLESRIRTVVTVKLQRRMQTKNKVSIRRQALESSLQTNYKEASDLVQEIQLVKNKKVATMKCTQEGICTRPFRENFPPVVRCLFFETALIDAFEKTPVNRLSSIDWENLICTARKNLKAYQESSYC
eukprot:scaffold408_cov71-Cylindrotheca_fusiformis.AAC.9